MKQKIDNFISWADIKMLSTRNDIEGRLEDLISELEDKYDVSIDSLDGSIYEENGDEVDEGEVYELVSVLLDQIHTILG